MRNIKALGLALSAVFAFGAVLASGAQAGAPRWTVVEGGVARTLVASEERTVAGESTGDVTITGAGVSMTSTSCTISGRIIGSAAGSPGTYTGTQHCTGWVVPGAPKCVINSEGAAAGTVISTPLTGRLVWLKQRPDVSSVGLTLEPDAGSTAFSHIEVTGAGCAATNKFTVTGNTICTATPVGQDAINGTLDCPSTPIKKYFTNQTPTRTEDEDTGTRIGAGASTFVAHFVNIKLSSGVEWGIENG